MGAVGDIEVDVIDRQRTVRVGAAWLARVARRELRIPGMHTWTQPPRPHPYVEPVAAELERSGFAVELVPSDYDDGCRSADRTASTARVLVARRRNVPTAS